MIYNSVVERYFFHPEHVGALATDMPSVVHVVGNLKRSERKMHLYVHYDTHGLVHTVCFKAAGCPYVIAGLEWVCRYMEGKKVSQLQLSLYPVLIEELEIPTLAYHIALQIEQIYKEAVSRIKHELGGNS